MDWKSVGSAVADAAPLLGAALGGPAGGLVGGLVALALGADKDPEAVTRALQANPDAMVKLREVEASMRKDLLDFQARQQAQELANVQGARGREVQLARAGHGAAWATSAVALTVTAGFFVMLSQVLDGPAKTSDAALLLLGSLGTAFGAVVNYYLGSSLGSSRKTDLLAQTAGPAEVR